MESLEDKQWASKYLLDPLTAPEPSDETGPGTHHNTVRTSSTVSRKPIASSVCSSAIGFSDNNKNGYPTPPNSSDSERFPGFDGVYNPNRFSSTTASSQIPTSTSGTVTTTSDGTNGTRARRASSLQQRHPGDRIQRPLDMARDSEKKAQRSPRLRKKHHVGADSIDSLDDITGVPYHHEGPYDAALLARNIGAKDPPLAAVAAGNAEALKATPREKVMDSIQKHYPLDGVAAVPPGMYDREGRYYNYEEGTDMMREGNPEGGAYKRWAHVKYLPEDLKGKGEPSYSLEKALKTHRRNVSESNQGSYEMITSPSTAHSGTTGATYIPNIGSPHQRSAMHHRSSSAGAVSAHRAAQGAERYVDWERRGTGIVRRSDSVGGVGARLRKRMGSLRVRSP